MDFFERVRAATSGSKLLTGLKSNRLHLILLFSLHRLKESLRWAGIVRYNAFAYMSILILRSCHRDIRVELTLGTTLPCLL